MLKEENDQTIEYLNSLPIKRNKIVESKYLCGLILIFAMVIIIGIFNYIGLLFSGEFDTKVYFLLAITPIFPSVVIYTLCMFLSTFTHKTKTRLGVSLGIVFVSYILNMLSTLDESIEFLKYVSIFTLADIRNIIQQASLQMSLVLLTIIITIGLYILIQYRYNKKELL